VNVLVTGGAGYIGSAVTDLLAASGHTVVVVDNLSTGNLDALTDGVEFHELSVGAAAMDDLLASRRFDVCLHFAGSCDLAASMSRPEAFFANNVGETLALLRSLVDHGVSKLIFSSSATVYGEPLYTPIDEDHRTQTINPYGESKLLVEHALTWLATLGRIRFAALRYFNAAGAVGSRPERHRPETHLIPLALEVAAGEREALNLYGDDYPTRDGTCIRDYIHLADLATAHVAAVDALDDAESLVCNLGTGTGSTNAEVLQSIREVTGKDLSVRVTARRPGDPAVLVASNERARRVLSWEPTHSGLDEIVSDAWSARQARSGTRS
jgi:UDP-glucose 4-epimerase